MTRRFIRIKASDGSALLLNPTYITQITPIHGNDVNDGVDLLLIVFGETGVVQIDVPASQVQHLLSIVLAAEANFIDISTTSGERIILNTEYITHISPMHGNDFNDGANVSVFGNLIQVPASAARTIQELSQTAT